MTVAVLAFGSGRNPPVTLVIDSKSGRFASKVVYKQGNQSSVDKFLTTVISNALYQLVDGLPDNISCIHWQREERFGKYDHIDQLVVANPSCYLGIRRFFEGDGPDSTHITVLTNLVTRRTVFVAESRLKDENHPSVQISEHFLVKTERSGRVTIHSLNLAPLIVSELQIISEKRL